MTSVIVKTGWARGGRPVANMFPRLATVVVASRPGTFALVFTITIVIAIAIANHEIAGGDGIRDHRPIDAGIADPMCPGVTVGARCAAVVNLDD